MDCMLAFELGNPVATLQSPKLFAPSIFDKLNKFLTDNIFLCRLPVFLTILLRQHLFDQCTTFTLFKKFY